MAITPVNDAPLFPSTVTTVLPTARSEAQPVGVNVADAFPGFSDPKDVGKTNGGDNRVGVLITSNATSPAQGNWQYFDGNVWVDVPRNVSDSNALYLPDGTQIRFKPADGFSGTPGNLSARLVEDDQAGSKADLTANATGSGFGPTNAIRTGVDLSAGVGGTSRISGNTRDVGISITPVPVVSPVTPPVDLQQLNAPAGAGTLGNGGAAASLLGFVPADVAPVGLAVQQSQAMSAAQEAAGNQLFASNLGNSGLQPNWLMPEGIPGQDPFAAPLPEVQAAVPVPFEAAPRKALTAEELRLIECAKPRVVAKPRLPGAIARPMPRFEPGSEAAKRFSEQLKRARARARC